jgi:hypothetical protein
MPGGTESGSRVNRHVRGPEFPVLLPAFVEISLAALHARV